MGSRVSSRDSSILPWSSSLWRINPFCFLIVCFIMPVSRSLMSLPLVPQFSPTGNRREWWSSEFSVKMKTQTTDSILRRHDSVKYCRFKCVQFLHSLNFVIYASQKSLFVPLRLPSKSECIHWNNMHAYSNLLASPRLYVPRQTYSQVPMAFTCWGGKPSCSAAVS